MRYRLRSLDVMSVAKLMACIHGCFGILVIPFFLIMALFSAASAEQTGFSAFFFGMMCLVMPLMYAFMGFVMGALMAWLYNVVSGYIGPMEFRLDIVQAAATVENPFPPIA